MMVGIITFNKLVPFSKNKFYMQNELEEIVTVSFGKIYLKFIF